MVVVEVVVVVDVVVAVGVMKMRRVYGCMLLSGEKVRARVGVRKGSTANRAEPSGESIRLDSTLHQPAPLAQRNNNLSSSPSPPPFPPPSLFPSPKQCQPRLLPTYHSTLYPLFIYTLSTIPSSPNTSIFLKVNE
jgi:hypothetical protein